MYDGLELHGVFKELDPDIAFVIKQGLKKYKKYYTFMDNSEIYYTVLALDPWVKGDLIIGELEDKEAGKLILKAICDNLCQKYLLTRSELLRSGISGQSTPVIERSSVESRMLQRLQSQSLPVGSDINWYFDIPCISVTDTSDSQWLCNWWRLHRDKFPQMAAAARDYLAIPASEVAVERLFNIGRDLLGIFRLSMTADIIRILMLLHHSV